MNHVFSSIAAGVLCGAVSTASAAVAEFSTADFDRWNYPFNATPGSRSTASTFGAFDNAMFDNRDGQFLIGFDTSAILPALGPGQSLQINSVTVTATHSTGAFAYDPTYDTYRNSLDPSDPDYLADSDAGTPIVLTGAGLRGAYTGFGFGSDSGGGTIYEEDEAFGDNMAGPPPANAGDRTAFAAAFDDDGNLIDVSNNVRDGFDFTPFAVGTTNLTPGALVVEANNATDPNDREPGSTFSFAVNLANADILAYIQQGIADGGLFFTISSLHGAAEMAGGENPNFYTTDNFDLAAIAPTLKIDYTVVPEPASLALLLVGGGLMLGRRMSRAG